MKLSLGTSSAVPEMSLNIDGKESFHEYWKLLLHYAFISPHWGGREIKLLISNFINSLIYSESHIKQNFSLKYLNIPSCRCARYFSEAQEVEGIRCFLISNGNEWDLLCPACRACPLLENKTPCQVLSIFFAAFAASLGFFRSSLINGAEDSLLRIYRNKCLKSLELSSCERERSASDCILQVKTQRNTVQETFTCLSWST